ncbi:hypothetical protein [Paludibacterium denitrificans]|uniref:Uncharacterized protein n=1 Tax=Paludibacterium denitrificans TaxID=2675226 RepID=A0A844GCA5_9NEIS|nr:hypothetical protein [Paludibacterium denitrificans]MTD34113.1 hypothetical protein [Paludibacterium denitrificans]
MTECPPVVVIDDQPLIVTVSDPEPIVPVIGIPGPPGPSGTADFDLDLTLIFNIAQL